MFSFNSKYPWTLLTSNQISTTFFNGVYIDCHDEVSYAKYLRWRTLDNIITFLNMEL